MSQLTTVRIILEFEFYVQRPKSYVVVVSFSVSVYMVLIAINPLWW